jgi:hypothetical protein
MSEDIVYTFKEYINNKDIEGIKEYIDALTESDESVEWDYIFQKVYIHACLKKNKPVAELLLTKFAEMEPQHQIIARQVLAYGRYLMDR